MTSGKRLPVLGALAFVVIGALSVVTAQTGPPGQGGSWMYDVKTETTITGSVEAVETISEGGGRGRRAMGGTHLTVRTDTGTVAVHVGPTAYLTGKGIVLAKGDTVEILGSRVTAEQEAFVIARQIRKGGDTWTLRDASGRPAWSGRGR
jgi:hypothetical protein